MRGGSGPRRPATRRTRLGALALLVAAVPGGCMAGSEGGSDGGRDGTPEPERVDSAGTTIVTTAGPDRPLPWRTEEVLRLGPAEEGPRAFFRVAASGSGLAADAAGAIYVLDGGHGEVRVFDGNGTYRRTLGRPGEGPAELTSPTRLFVTAGGVVAVADGRKRALVRFDADGSPMAPLTVREHSLTSSDLRGYASGGLVLTVDEPYRTIEDARAGGPRTTRLIHLALDIGDPAAAVPDSADSAVELARWTERPDSGVLVRPCESRVSFRRPLKPSQPVAGAAARIVWASGPEYVIEMVGPEGTRSSIRRALAPVPASPELAARDFRPVSIELASHETCEITGERAVEAAGFDPVVPWITDVRVAPDGGLFVERRDPQALPTRRIDVFGPDGAYRGTLPVGFPFPAAFHTPDSFLRVERDDLGVPAVVLYRIVRD